jgi:acetyl esterase/lipase
LELIQDLRDVYKYVVQSLNVEFPSLIDLKRIIVAGGSGGGYCVELLGAQFKSTDMNLKPPPAALLALYPMSNPCSEMWTSTGLRWDEGLSAPETAETAADIERRLADQEVSFGEAFPEDENMNTHKRWNTLRYILEQALFVDYLTGVKGLGAAIADRGPEAIPGYLQELFPTHFSITSQLPPLIVVHGTKDVDVPVTDGEAWINKCREVGAKVTYYPVEGMDHAFDITYESVEGEDLGDDRGKIAVAESLKELDSLIR